MPWEISTTASREVSSSRHHGDPLEGTPLKPITIILYLPECLKGINLYPNYNERLGNEWEKLHEWEKLQHGLKWFTVSQRQLIRLCGDMQRRHQKNKPRSHRGTRVSRHHEYPIEGHPETSRTITVLWYWEEAGRPWIGPPLRWETPVSDASFCIPLQRHNNLPTV